MNAAPNLEPPAQDQAVPDRVPAAERLETALGGDLTRFLLSGLVASASNPAAQPR
jgi:hypothetical protein